MAAGTIIASFFIDLTGRRTAMILSSVPYLFGWLFIVYGTNPSWLIGGRFMIGFAVGTSAISSNVSSIDIDNIS